MPSSEFPNDNPDLHDGAILMCLEVCGAPEVLVPASRNATEEDRPSMILPVGTHLVDEHDGPVSLETLAAEVGVDTADGIVVEELEFFEEPLSVRDPFTTFVATLAEVARCSGDIRAAAALPALLCDGLIDAGSVSSAALDALRQGALVCDGASGVTASSSLREVAIAWSRVLRGESDDISGCGPATLDEWSAELLARLLAAPQKASQLRRELRSRGIAAFGMVDAA